MKQTLRFENPKLCIQNLESTAFPHSTAFLWNQENEWKRGKKKPNNETETDDKRRERHTEGRT